jgi:hypothetical protein
MECEFEEKQYEYQMNRQLEKKRSVTFVSGQVLENTIGIDAAILSYDPIFWSLWRAQNPKSGIRLSPKLWDFMKKHIDNDEFPAKFKYNVFMQYKRPEYISSPRANEFKTWNKPYFRYDIDDEQQDILCRLEQKVSKCAIVAYACPSFWRRKELWRYQANRRLVENSNFVQPIVLNGHKRYTFVKSGKDGIPFSEPKKTLGISLLEEIDKLSERQMPFESNSGFITSLYKNVREVVDKSSEEFREGYYLILESAGPLEHNLARSLAGILTFCFMVNVSWAIGYVWR